MKILEHLLDVLINPFLHLVIAAAALIAAPYFKDADTPVGRQAAAIAGVALPIEHGAANGADDERSDPKFRGVRK